MVARRWIAEPTNLVNRLVHTPETETPLQFHDHRDLVALPPTGEPPPRIRVNKHTPPVIQMILNNRKELIARPPATRSNRPPTPRPDRRPVLNRDRLPAGNHDRVRRQLFKPVPVLPTHRASLNEFLAHRTHKNKQDNRQQPDNNRA